MSRRKCRVERQLNKNAGFSLIELLIAVIVLAIIIVPFTRSFMSSSRMNGSSRRLQRATTVAQDIVEGLKAYNIDELQEQFNNPLDGFYIIDSRLIHGKIEEDTGREALEADGVYYFKMEDVRIQNVEYDALIKVDASVYGKGTTVHDNEFNVSDMAKPGSVIKGKDGSYVQGDDVTKAALNEIKSRYELEDPSAPPLPLNEGESFSFKTFTSIGGEITKRTIELDIDYKKTEKEENEAGVEEDVVYCDAVITIEYECKYNGVVENILVRDGITVSADITSGNFYLFYYPCYEAKEDNIIINNNSKGPFQIFVVKQVEMDSAGNQMLSDSQLDIAERQYRVVVDVNDSIKNDIKNTLIRTNLGVNMVNSTFTGGGGRPSGGQMPTYEVEKEDIPTQVAAYKFNGADLGKDTGVNVFGLAGTKFRGTGETNVMSDKITEVIFDIEVSIYKEGAYADDFPEGQRMVLIKGSKNN